MGGDGDQGSAGEREQQSDGGGAPFGNVEGAHEHGGPAPDDPQGGELPRLMARLGRLLERHGAGGVVVMSSQEYERAQLSTYAAGWQDAAQEYGPRISAARWEGWLGRWRPLRLLDEPADVIAFPAGPAPAESQGQGKDDQVADEFGPPSGERPGLAVRGRTPVPRPYLSPKSRRSKSPTIPRLPPPDRRRPRTAGDAPEDGPE